MCLSDLQLLHHLGRVFLPLDRLLHTLHVVFREALDVLVRVVVELAQLSSLVDVHELDLIVVVLFIYF